MSKCMVTWAATLDAIVITIMAMFMSDNKLMSHKIFGECSYDMTFCDCNCGQINCSRNLQSTHHINRGKTGIPYFSYSDFSNSCTDYFPDDKTNEVIIYYDVSRAHNTDGRAYR